jgi:soluble lytic murein transglycosylase-like protein
VGLSVRILSVRNVFVRDTPPPLKRARRRLRKKVKMLVTILVITFVLLAPQSKAQSKAEIIYNISATAKLVDIDPDIAVAIGTVESGINPQAVGGMGEIGVFQLRPEYHPVIKGNYRHNILVGVAYLAEVKAKCAKFGDAWFVCFNYGPYNKLKRPHETVYYKRVMKALSQIKFKRYVVGN